MTKPPRRLSGVQKDGKVLLHVSAGGQLVATFEPESALACLVENQPFLAGLWHGIKTVAYGGFGDGRAPVTIFALAIVLGLILGLRYNRRRLYQVYGISTPSPWLIARDPFKQVVLMVLIAGIVIGGIPQQAFADSPTYDPVFYYYLNDHLGSSSIILDRNGEIVQRYGYTPFGHERYQENSQAFSVSNRYTGQVLDEDTGLYYYGARYYDAELGRFIQADTVVPDPGFSQAFNRYAYVYNNPIKLTDPTGQCVFAIMLIANVIMAGIQAAANHGNILEAMAFAAFTSLLTYGLSNGLGLIMPPPIAQVAAAAIAGGVSASIQGGNFGQGALIGAISTAVFLKCAQVPMPGSSISIGNINLKELAQSAFAGAMSGGVSAEMNEQNFGEGASWGAASAASGYVVKQSVKAHVIKKAAEKPKNNWLTKMKDWAKNNIKIPGLNGRWHGNWGGSGWGAGREVSESELTDSDRAVKALDSRDKGYYDHDWNINKNSKLHPNDAWARGAGVAQADLALGAHTMTMNPLEPSFWFVDGPPINIFGIKIPIFMPAPIEAGVLWFTVAPIHHQLNPGKNQNAQ